MKCSLRMLATLIAGPILLCGGSACFAQEAAIGSSALIHVKALVALGPRPPGSEAHTKTQRYIIETLERNGVVVEQIPFVAKTPVGSIGMNNIIGRIRGSTSESIIVVAAHYDTKLEHGFQFLGANDGGSGTGLLLALATVLTARRGKHEIRLVFFDGEEPLVQWSESDSLYGSRHLAAKWKEEGVLPRIKAFVLVDMIGDSELGILRESHSTPQLLDQIWSIASRLGLANHFLAAGRAVEDDHVPFLREGVPAVNLIDFNYGPRSSFWHTPDDTVDKVSARSLEVVGTVLVELIADFDRER